MKFLIVLILFASDVYAQQYSQVQNERKDKICRERFLRSVVSDIGPNSPWIKVNAKYGRLKKTIFVRTDYLFRKYGLDSHYDFINTVVFCILNNSYYNMKVDFSKDKNLAFLNKDTLSKSFQLCHDSSFINSYNDRRYYTTNEAKQMPMSVLSCLFDLNYIIKEADFDSGISVRKYKCEGN